MNKLFYGDNLDVLREHVADGSVGGSNSDIPHILLACLEREDRAESRRGNLL